MAESATEFLIAQQCDEGFFLQDFAAIDAADQDCDADPNAAPSTDVTALAVLALLPQDDDTDVEEVIDDELKARVPRGKRQVVQIRGLADFEEYRVKVNRKLVDDGRANAKGRAVARFGVGRKTGVVKVVVLGEFKNRRATKAFTVTR